MMTSSSIIHLPHSYQTLRVEEHPDQNSFWCYMHKGFRPYDERACFRTRLIDEILDFQKASAAKIRRQNDRGEIAHVVLASDTDVFNLGGDLELFGRCIRTGDREQLLHYAKRCVIGVHAFYQGLGCGAHSIALVQGDALGGGFEAALSCNTIVAEKGSNMGLPEVLFDLFPGMGAYSFLCQRTSPTKAEKLMLDGIVYSAEQLHDMGLVDVLVEKGEGVNAVNALIRQNRKTPNARKAMQRVRQMTHGVSINELMAITEVWVDTALQLGEKSLRTMERLVKAQLRRSTEIPITKLRSTG